MKYGFFLLLIFVFISIRGMMQDIPPQFVSPERLLGEVTINEQATLMQVEVLNQFKTPGSTPASCAYHALRNGILLANACLLPEQRSDYFTQLHDINHMNSLLGEQGSWRNLILRNRAGLRSDSDWVDNAEILILARENAYNTNNTKTRVTIATYGDQAEAIPEKGMLPEKAIALKKEFELAQLSDKFTQIKNSIQAREDFAAIILVYVTHWGNRSFFEELGESVKEFFNSWLPSNQNNALKNVYNEGTSSRGHWITLVVNSVNGWRQYLVADSAANYSRLDDSKILQAIDLLEDGIIKKSSPLAKAHETSIIGSSTSGSSKSITQNTETQALVADPVVHEIRLPTINPRYNPHTLKKSASPTKNSILARYIIASAAIGTCASAAYWLYKKKNAQTNTERNTHALAIADTRVM